MRAATPQRETNMADHSAPYHVTRETISETASEGGLIRGLGFLDATMLVAGSMIGFGSGIFIVSADIARQVGSPGWLLAICGRGSCSYRRGRSGRRTPSYSERAKRTAGRSPRAATERMDGARAIAVIVPARLGAVRRADEVEGAGHERRERRCERDEPDDLHADGRPRWTVCYSAMYISKNRSAAVFLKSSACVGLLTSPSSTTTSSRARKSTEE
jgi:hypothetical protein